MLSWSQYRFFFLAVWNTSNLARRHLHHSFQTEFRSVLSAQESSRSTCCAYTAICFPGVIVISYEGGSKCTGTVCKRSWNSNFKSVLYKYVRIGVLGFYLEALTKHKRSSWDKWTWCKSKWSISDQLCFERVGSNCIWLYGRLMRGLDQG